MLTLSSIIMSAFRVGSTEPRSPRRRARRNAMGDVTVGISADQLHSLEATVQTYMPDFFNPSSAGATGEEGSQRRNAVGNLCEKLSTSDLQHLEEMVQTHQIGNTHHYHSSSSYHDDSSSGDGEESCSSPSATGLAYSSHRRNALANALVDLDDETLRTLQSLHHCSRNGYSARVWNIDNRRI